MYTPSVELTKDGILVRAAGGPEPYEVSEIPDLLQIWHWRLEAIDPEFTLADLCAHLRGIEDVDALSCLVNSPLGAILEYEPGEDDGADEECPLRCLEVCNVARPTVYQPDPHRPDRPAQVVRASAETVADTLAAARANPGEMLIGIEAPDEVTGQVEICRVIVPEQHGTWGGPFYIERKFRGVGMPSEAELESVPAEARQAEYEYNLFFATPPEVEHLPLRYNPIVRFGEGEGEGDVQQVSIAVGEFLYAVFRGLGFNGPPEHRRAMLLALRSGVGEAGQDGGDAVPEP